MKITKPQHKNLLISSFFKKNQHGQIEPVTFQIEKLADAGSAKKKLLDCVNKENNQLNDEEVEFSPAEVSILKELFDVAKKVGYTADEAEEVLSLKDIFDGKKDKDSK